MPRQSTLDNGIRVVTEHLPGSRACALGLLAAVGPIDETPRQRGMTHLLEHMLFQGTSSRDALSIARWLDSAGGRVGAFTAREYTCFQATVLDEHTPYALDLFADITQNSIFPEALIESEKDAIVQEIEAHYDIPDRRANSLLKQSVWPEHPLGREVAASVDDVRRLTREDLIYYAFEHYTAPRLMIAAAGNIEHDDFVAQVLDGFWRLGEGTPRRPLKAPRYRPASVWENRSMRQAYFSIAWPVAPYADPDRYVLHAFHEALGGGMSSRLFRNLREERGLVYHIGSEVHAYADAGLLVIEGATAPECLEETIETIGGTLAELLESRPVDEEELRIVRNRLRSQFLLGTQDPETRLASLLNQEYYFGQPLQIEDIARDIEGVSKPQIDSFCQTFRRDIWSQASLAIVGPESATLDSEHLVESLRSNGSSNLTVLQLEGALHGFRSARQEELD